MSRNSGKLMSKCPLWPDNEVDKLPKVTCISARKKIRAEKLEIGSISITKQSDRFNRL